MSLDRFIAGPKDDDKPDRELEALERLHDWMFPPKGNFQEIECERFKNVGAKDMYCYMEIVCLVSSWADATGQV